jgi:hypothetical protein
MSPPDDRPLLELVRRISDAGFDMVLLSHGDRVEALAYRPCGDVHLARCVDGDGPAAVAAVVSALAQAVDP